jgi:hypothetical protein
LEGLGVLEGLEGLEVLRTRGMLGISAIFGIVRILVLAVLWDRDLGERTSLVVRLFGVSIGIHLVVVKLRGWKSWGH